MLNSNGQPNITRTHLEADIFLPARSADDMNI